MFTASLARRPWQHPLEQLSRKLEDLFDGNGIDFVSDDPLAPYPMDIRQDDAHVYVEAELPGFAKEDINISLEKNILTIQAERKEETTHKGEVLRHERRWTRFMRSFQLPGPVNENTVKANLMDGVLKITLDRNEIAKPKKIEIGTAPQPTVSSAKPKP